MNEFVNSYTSYSYLLRSSCLFFTKLLMKLANTRGIFALSLWFSGMAWASLMFFRVYVSRNSMGNLEAFVSLEMTSMALRLTGQSIMLSRYYPMTG
jgi:hypothetical protein